jgi:hypothetical protein
MGLLAMLNHALNFAAPALWLALLMPLVAKFFTRKKPVAHTFPAQFALHFVVCLVGLMAGLVFFGNDGKMLTYLLLLLLCATSQWLMQRGWRG